ncbi:MAG: hypothetical protein H6636_13935 [Anaerolineales bacterium]|nr:hypothetical protein [Anaerolineales bacterium]
MTAIFEQNRRQASTFTTVITVIALLLGWGLKTYVQGQTRAVTVHEVRAQVPAGWIVQENDPVTNIPSDDPFQMKHPEPSQNLNLVFTAWNPLHAERHYSVSLYPGGEGTALPDIASVRTLNRGTSLRLYRTLEGTPILVHGRDGYKVTFAYVDAGAPGQVPTVIQGVDYYFAEGEQTVVITLEVDNGAPTDSLPEFLNFVQSVEIGD